VSVRRGRGPDPSRPRSSTRISLIVGLLIGLIIVVVLVWVIGTWPRPGWRQPVQVPVAPAPQ
jgi:hypothetical protein